MYEYNCKITKVINSNTVESIVDLGFSVSLELRIHLLAVTTFEKDLEDKAKEFIEKEVLNKWCILRMKKGKYSKYAGEIFTREGYSQPIPISINEKLLRKNFK